MEIMYPDTTVCYRIIVGLRCGFEGRVTTSVEFKSVPRKIFGPSDAVR